MVAYATLAEVRARVDPTYAGYDIITDDVTLTKAILKASEVIDEHTMTRAAAAWDSEVDIDEEDWYYRPVLARAVADQVEFWAEVGPEHDVTGLRGSVVAGRLQLHPTAPTLSPRAKRTLYNAGLYWAGASIG
jgi:hypothetical protein